MHMEWRIGSVNHEQNIKQTHVPKRWAGRMAASPLDLEDEAMPLEVKPEWKEFNGTLQMIDQLAPQRKPERLMISCN